jgi:electron transfer flavoprotein beta subunit
MRILVSFKVTPDYEALRESDWAAGAARGGVEARYVRRILGCFDEGALELALRLADTLAERGGTSNLDALTVGGRATEPYLKTLLALGFDKAARVQTEAALDFVPAVTASIIAGHAVRAADRDLVLLGCRSDPGDSGTVPFLVAETLGWPCLTQVIEVESLGGDRLRVICAADEGLLRVTLRLPCVLAVGNAIVSRLRVPTLQDRLARRSERVDVIEPADLGVDIDDELGSETCILTGLETIDRTRRGIMIGGETPHEKAQVLYDAYLEGMLENL